MFVNFIGWKESGVARAKERRSQSFLHKSCLGDSAEFKGQGRRKFLNCKRVFLKSHELIPGDKTESISVLLERIRFHEDLFGCRIFET